MTPIISHLRKSISLSLLTVLFGSISIVTLANGSEPIGDHSAATAEVKYIAAKDGEGLFNVIYNNAAGARFSIGVLDEYGNQLYQGVFSGNVLANSSLSGLTQQQLQKMNFTDIQKAASTPRQTSSGSVFNP